MDCPGKLDVKVLTEIAIASRTEDFPLLLFPTRTVTFLPGLKFNTIDPTGAGDNFLTGLIYGLYHELPLVDCIRYGNIMGGLCTEVLGCFRWDLNPQMIEAYWNQCPEAQEITHFEL